MAILQFLQNAGVALLRMLPIIANAARTLGPRLMTFLSRLGPMLTRAWNGLVNGVKAVGNWLWPILKNAWNGLVNGVKAAGNWLGPILKNAWSGLANGVKAAGNWLGPILKNAWSGLVNGVKAAGNWLGPILKNAWSGLVNGVKAVGSWLGPRILPFLGNAAKFLGNGLKRVFGFLVGRVFPLLGNATKTLGGIFQGIAPRVWGAVQQIVSVLATLGSFLLQAGIMFTHVMLQATQAAMEYAKAVNDLRLRTGMNMKDATSTSFKFGVFGITPEMLAEARNGNHESLYRLRARMWRVDPTDPVSINTRAQQFDNSLFGHLFKQQMLSDIGHNNPQGRLLASLPPDLVRGQLKFQEELSQKLNISPNSIKRMAEVLPLAMERLNMFVRMLQLKFVETALPVMERAFALLSRIAVQSASTIKTAFETSIEWLYVHGPILVIQGAQIMVSALKWISDSLFDTAFSILNFIETIENPNTGIGAWVGSLTKAMDFLYEMSKNTVDAFHYIRDHISNFVLTIANVVMTVIQKIAEAAGWLPSGILSQVGIDKQKLQKLQNPTLHQIDPVVMGSHTQNWQHPQYHNNYLNWAASKPVSRYTQPISAHLTNSQIWVNNKLNDATQLLGQATQHFGDIDSRQRTYDAMLAQLEAIRQASETTAKNSSTGNSSDNSRDWLVRVMMEKSRQRYLMETR